VRSLALVSSAFILMVAASAHAASSDSAPALSGKMAALKYLVGTWNCTTKVPAYGNMPAQTVQARNIYWIEPGNVLGNYYSSKPFSSSGFIGWMASKNLWWNSNADVYGGTALLTGKDSAGNVHVMTGTSWSQGKATASRDTMTKNSDASYSDEFVELAGDKVTFHVSTACTKTSDKPAM
jgi:hypothetical protein